MPRARAPEKPAKRRVAPRASDLSDRSDSSDFPDTATPGKRQKPKSRGHGGARPGAGRKPEGREPVTMHLHPAVIEALRLRGRRIGEFVEPLVVTELVRLLATALRQTGPAPLPDYALAIARCLEKVGPGYVQSAIRLAERK